jgi:hypothetical protein
MRSILHNEPPWHNLLSATAQFAFDADMRALLEGGGVLAQLAPGLYAVPFGPRFSLSVPQKGRLAGDREGRDGLAVRGRFGFGIAAAEVNEFNAIEVLFFFSPFVPCLGRPEASGRHSQGGVNSG